MSLVRARRFFGNSNSPRMSAGAGNLFRIRTYEKSARKSFAIRTYKNSGLNLPGINTYKKHPGGGGSVPFSFYLFPFAPPAPLLPCLPVRVPSCYSCWRVAKCTPAGLEYAGMGQPRFVHLHLHTDYSLLDGACEISELVNEAARRGMPAVAVTDHGNLFAAANFYHEATTRGVKPLIGCEVYVARGSRHDRGAASPGSEAASAGRAGADPGLRAASPEPVRGTNHLLLLCENNEGYRNLIQLVSAGFLEGFYYKPRIDHDLLAKHSRGLIGLSACLRGA